MLTQTIFSQTPPIEPGVSQTLAKWRAENYSDVRYKLNITLEKGAPLMKGEIEIRVNLTEIGAKNDLILDWRNTQFANDKDKPFANVIAVNETTGAQASSLANVAESGVKTLDSDNDSSERTSFSRSALIAGRLPALPTLALQSNEHLIIPKKFLKTGENVIKIQFASPIKSSGAAVTRYVDKEDGTEYVYSLFVPSDASTAFPVFDQPDLKARFKLYLDIPKGWKAISNTESRPSDTVFMGGQEFSLPGRFFDETKPISTYVFAFAAGEFEEIEDKNNSTASRESGEKKVARRETSGTNIKTNFSTEGATENESWRISDARTSVGDDTRRFTSGYFLDAPSARKSVEESNTIASQKSENLSTKIYVRKSQAEKFKQHADEVFRLNREGVKFLEEWFDYKFPFPKYDLVLIPEFPFGGMEHAGATFLREDRIIFPTEPTKNDFITRANLIFHEAAHQWFGDTVTMKWFDDLWLKEGFAEFMAYKTLEKVLPEYNAWKVFYERNKQAAYLTDVTCGTTPIYQEIPNLSSAKSAYGNIVYRKAPSFLRQAEYFLGEKNFQMAVRAFLKKNQFANAEWTDLITEFEISSWETLAFSNVEKSKQEKRVREEIRNWANNWVKNPGLPIISVDFVPSTGISTNPLGVSPKTFFVSQKNSLNEKNLWTQKFNICIGQDGESVAGFVPTIKSDEKRTRFIVSQFSAGGKTMDVPGLVFPNCSDYGYGIFLLDRQSRNYVSKRIGAEKDDFLRSMMWGSLWDSVRFYELAPEEYVRLVIKNISAETDESTIQTLLGRVSAAMTYYLSEPPAVAGGLTRPSENSINATLKPSATADGTDLQAQLEKLLVEKMQNAPTAGLKITYYRAFVANASSENARKVLKEFLRSAGSLAGVSDAKAVPTQAPVAGRLPALQLRSKDKFDIVTKLIVLGDEDGLKLLAELEKTETDDASKRYAYAARAGIPTKENKAKYWKDFTENREIPESWIEAAFSVWNSPKHAELTLPYLEKSLAELPNLKRNRKIFFVNGWLSSFIGGQKSAVALKVVNDFLEKNPNLDIDLRRKILENSDNLERAVKIREKYK